MPQTGEAIEHHDAPTVAAIAAIAALAVIVNHEALGHGSVCLAVGGQVTLLSSSLFRCSAPSALIDIGGPSLSLTLGLVALIARQTLAAHRTDLKLGLLLVATFAGFWEGGYLVEAMATRKGDLYGAGTAFIGEPSLWWRGVGGLAGAALYAVTWRLTAQGLASMGEGRRLGRIAWIAATAATVLTASVYRGGWGENLVNAFLEIGLASLPLLLLMQDGTHPGPGRSIRPRPSVWIGAVVIAIAFAATLGWGIGDAALA